MAQNAMPATNRRATTTMIVVFGPLLLPVSLAICLASFWVQTPDPLLDHEPCVAFLGDGCRHKQVQTTGCRRRQQSVRCGRIEAQRPHAVGPQSAGGHPSPRQTTVDTSEDATPREIARVDRATIRSEHDS